ncbi:MAG: isoleucyl-tRNA synthetase [Myxococcales bacterium]|nr:isoleucyl-tRNA synthetase [Myxococcales bacterium]
MDWKQTLNLPKTDFPMRADLAKREPQWLERWAAEKQYERVLAARAAEGATSFVLHDGPPYPTGGIHYGTVLNKVLKDLVVRSQLLMGKRAVFRPGWDCHGLPIEQQVEKELGKDAKALDAPAFRRKCEEHALKFVDVMRGEFKRLGCLGNWDDPYLTLSKDYEATIVRQLAAFARRGLVYRDKKPVHWCLVHKTALAEAEVEYEDHSSPSIYVRMPLVESIPSIPALAGRRASLVIWTTTPWTLPANLAVVANPELSYVAIQRDGEFLIVAAGRAEAFLAATGITSAPSTWIPIEGAALRALEGVRYEPPFPINDPPEAAYRLYFARHATLEAGTGLVHTAPGHGADDYIVGREHKLPIYAPVDATGKLDATVGPGAAKYVGENVFKANPLIVNELAERGLLLNQAGETLRHSYPCCWRCKNPIIFRATEQWFARLGEADDPKSLRHDALVEIGETQWIPSWGENRIRGMIEARPDWCLSRQRVWGVPIPAFRCTSCGKDLLDATVMEHVADVFAREGSNVWFRGRISDLMPTPAPHCSGCGASSWETQHDIVDVWFESGVSWAAVAEDKLVKKGEKVDLYLEGSDQHRGWFHSSLLTGCATRGQAPYKAVLTHGWVLDERGKVYSKSEIAKAKASGAKIDYVDPIVWMQKNGAELLRLWTAASDYQGDIVFSQTILNQLGESYRKIRNTCKYLLSNLYDFQPSRDVMADHDLRELDLLALGVLRERDHQIFEAYQRFSFHEVVRLMNDYVVTASAEYLDPVKDALYCEAAAGGVRRSVQTALHEMTRTIATWIAPVLCFTAQDVADELGRLTGEPFDVHASVRLVDQGEKMGNPNKRWTDEVRPRREAILQPLEKFRAAGHKPLEARVRVKPARDERPHWQWNLGLLTDLVGVSRIELDAADAASATEIVIDEAPGPECPRCWRRTGEASGAKEDPNLCLRCAAVVAEVHIPPSPEVPS